MNPNWYDILDVDRDASADEIRAAWKASIADLDPTDRRFRVRNEAAEVLLDADRRTAYDAQLATAEHAERAATAEAEDAGTPDEPAPAAESGSVVTQVRSGLWTPPGWLLAGLAIVTALVIAATAILATRPSDTSVDDATRAAQSAAEQAIVPVLSYDYEHLDESQAAAEQYLTEDYQEEYSRLFALIKQNAPSTQTKVEVQVVDSGIVRSGEDRAQVLLFVDRPTTNKANRQPVVYKDQVTVTMELVGGEWKIDELITSPPAG